jgi:phage terminase small subunit
MARPRAGEDAEGWLPTERRFVDEYLIDCNGAEAARRVGFAPKYASDRGAEILKRPHVAAEVARRMAARSHELQLTARRVLAELSCIAFFDPADVFDFSGDSVPWLRAARDIPERARRNIARVKCRETNRGGEKVREVEFWFWSKETALDKCMRHMDLLRDGKPADGEPDAGDTPRTVGVDELLAQVRAALVARGAGPAGGGPTAPGVGGQAVDAPPGATDTGVSQPGG